MLTAGADNAVPARHRHTEQGFTAKRAGMPRMAIHLKTGRVAVFLPHNGQVILRLSIIHNSEPTRREGKSYAGFT